MSKMLFLRHFGTGSRTIQTYSKVLNKFALSSITTERFINLSPLSL